MGSTWLLVLAVVVWTLLFVSAWEWLDRADERRGRHEPAPTPELQPALASAASSRARRRSR